ncbi:hypothetical protein [Pedobacter heparinus]|uniref:hypothetical protein n=1 Tax=Pedobacter heparinus TaxID=984 RepID=UPI00292D4905|nr:hypothetical protein [Pedobacter heparinus]
MKKMLVFLLLGMSQLAFAQKGKPYPGFPEKFETPLAETKSKYGKGEVVFKSGNWTLEQALIGDAADKDRFKGKQAIRMQQNLDAPSLLQMNFDLPNGASKVSFQYGAYGKDRSCTFILEYSSDEGKTWSRADQVITDASDGLSTATFKFDIKGNVRFRINKIGLGSSEKEASIKNGRLNIDDFTVYQN